MTRPSLYARAELAAKRFADRYFDNKYGQPRHSQARLDFSAGYLAGWRAAKRDGSKHG